jgi:hypothetical protein
MAVGNSLKPKAPTSNHGQSCTNHINNVKRLHDEGKGFDSPPSVFKELLESNLPDNEKTVDRLGAEATALIGAGTETTSRSIVLLETEKRPRLIFCNSSCANNFPPSYAAIDFS